ncbi:hypothetical protein [Paenibacillus donghaensis]|uniref:Uncharacterized protein n=1 Tax=Paenibacillus donghaensis TaxID=414771 RepID=A0A2Z2KSR6_9BACL|nr:hypothetical protein [Paenibacillus donghaensis]ASA23681.1 hypothetical protein B9T62_24550 [Paenibacillus donghaensis]
MNKEVVIRLIDEVTEEVFSQNKSTLEDEGVLTGNIELAIKLSALTTVKILEKLELIDKD